MLDVAETIHSFLWEDKKCGVGPAGQHRYLGIASWCSTHDDNDESAMACSSFFCLYKTSFLHLWM